MPDTAAAVATATRVRGVGTPERTTTAGRTRLGRSGPRSRHGCVTCKQRRVRCDETHPVCSHCTRLQLNCHYAPPPRRWRQQSQEQGQVNGTSSAERSDDAASIQNSQMYLGSPPVPLEQEFNAGVDISSLQSSRRTQKSLNVQDQALYSTPPVFGTYPRSGYATPSGAGAVWAQARRYDFNDIYSDLNMSWAGEFSCMLGDIESPTSPSFAPDMTNNPFASMANGEAVNGATELVSTSAIKENGVVSEVFKTPKTPRENFQRRPSVASVASTRPELHRPPSNENSGHLIRLFRKIVQPPAAILIGGFERWQRLQRYLCKLSDQSRAVNYSLLCVVELLVIDETSARERGGQERAACMSRILERHGVACEEMERKLSRHADLKPKTREHLLAAIFLLSWFEVIRDQDEHSDLFPRDLADLIIVRDATWNRYSQQLLSWLNTLDSKASHLGGEHLLSPKALEVVSHFPTQITSSLEQQGDGPDPRDPDRDLDDSDRSLSDLSPSDSHHSPEDVVSQMPRLRMGQVKQVMLNTILQPALEWYLTTQSYCRRISAHDKHHRRRFTSDDEYEVITACKQLESELFELWDYRPAVVSVAAEQLMAVLSPDVATRLEEIFSIYLASFWILFVYLHRVSWWNLPHSPLARRALAEVWRNTQRAYGEEVEVEVEVPEAGAGAGVDGSATTRRIIHPSLLWPVFLFGSECPDGDQRAWAIGQLEALGEAKPPPLLRAEPADAETLPPFRLSSGATRNAKRAAALLRELTKEQDARQARVDDRDLSMKMFGCYFSIV